jgi:hypothetical protein
MTRLHTGETLVAELQKFQLASEIEAQTRKKGPLCRIDHLVPLTPKERLRLRFTSAVKIKAVSYFFSALAGIAAGQYVQDIERVVTGYDPVKREQLFQRKADRIERNGWSPNANVPQERGRQDVGTLLNATYASLKQVMTDPKQFIENTETYQSVLEKYYNALKFIDDASFLIPAVLSFIMLGGYIDRRISRIQDDVLEAEERERLRSKINELIDVANRLADGTGRLSPAPSDASAMSVRRWDDRKN